MPRCPGYALRMAHDTPDPRIDPELVDEESLANTDVMGRLDKDPDAQRNREDVAEPGSPVEDDDA